MSKRCAHDVIVASLHFDLLCDGVHRALNSPKCYTAFYGNDHSIWAKAPIWPEVDKCRFGELRHMQKGFLRKADSVHKAKRAGIGAFCFAGVFCSVGLSFQPVP